MNKLLQISKFSLVLHPKPLVRAIGLVELLYPETSTIVKYHFLDNQHT